MKRARTCHHMEIHLNTMKKTMFCSIVHNHGTYPLTKIQKHHLTSSFNSNRDLLFTTIPSGLSVHALLSRPAYFHFCTITSSDVPDSSRVSAIHNTQAFSTPSIHHQTCRQLSAQTSSLSLNTQTPPSYTMESYEQVMERLRFADPDFYFELQETIERAVENVKARQAQQLAESFSNTERATSEYSQVFEDEPSWIISSKSIPNAANYDLLLLFFAFFVYLFYTKDRSRKPMSCTLLSRTFLCFLVLVIVRTTAVNISEDTIRLLLPTISLGALVGTVPTLLPPSRLWPRRVQRSEDAPQTWRDAFAYAFGFLLSNGFFAWVVLMTQGVTAHKG